MSKTKPATASKHSRSSKIATKAQRVAQAIVRSPKDSHLRSVGAGLTESPPERSNEQEALLVEKPVAFQQEALLVEHPATAFQDDGNNNSTKGFDFSSASANLRAYQAKLLEMAQANMQFAFEFAMRLATIRSPVEFLSVTAEFTSKRSAMFRKYSNEMAELIRR
jgi:hypothetical protein